MRKYILTVVILISSILLYSQTKEELYTRYEIDSLKKNLPSFRDSARIDCLNNIAYKYFEFDWDDQKILDSSHSYSEQAYKEAMQISYKKGIGYSYLWLAAIESLKNDIYSEKNGKDNPGLLAGQEKYIRQMLTTGEQINDYTIMGKAYQELSFLTYKKGNFAQAEDYLKKSISFLEKSGSQKQTSNYRDKDFARCEGCKGNEKWIIRMYYGMGRRYYNAQKYKDAAGYGKIAIKYMEKINDPGLAMAYWWLSDASYRYNNHDEAVNACKKSISLFHESGDEVAELSGYNELSKMYEGQGDFENGIEHSRKSIALAKKFVKSKQNGDRVSGQAFFWMSRLYKIGGDYETAMDIIRQGRNYYPVPIDSISNAFWTAEIGDIHRLMGNYDSAMYYLEPFKSSAQDRNNFGKVSLGFLYINLKEYDKALELITPFVNYLRDINRIRPPLVWGQIISASAFLGKKNYKASLGYAKEALVNLKIMNGRTWMINDYKLLSDIFRSMGNNDSAYYYLNQYTILKDSILNKQFYFRLNGYKKEAEEARKESRIGFLNRDNKIKEQQLKQEAQFKNFLLLGVLGLLITGFFIFRWLSLKRRNEKLRSIQLESVLKVQQLESEKKDTEFLRKSTELEMQALRAQMNPHFIFNCLSSINRFILKNETKIASNYLTRFSRLMRMVLMNSQKPLIALDDELQMLEIYLEMERLRFKNSFDYAITFLNTVDSDNVFIPPLLIQPFCENAIWHGLMHLPAGRQGKEGPGRLDIELSMQDNVLHCIITDNGVGREKAEEMNSKTAEKEKSMGLKITTERLALLNREKGLQTFYDIEDMEDENGNATGTRVILKISFKESVEDFA